MGGSITDEDKTFVEEWEHISPQQWGITRLDARGDERPEVIGGRRTFRITSEERILTQDRIRDEGLDPFMNGSFRPITVPDSITIATNPNALSDDEIKEILDTSSDIAWEENLKVIDSVATIRRMLEVAEETDLSLRRYRRLETRLVEVRGVARIDTKDPRLRNFLSDSPNPEADGPLAASGKGNPRRMGGRSADYRPS